MHRSLALPFASLLVAGWLAAATSAGAARFDAFPGPDRPDLSPGDGSCDVGGPLPCSLRAAIMEANALPGPDTIVLAAGTFTLTATGGGEDASATGDLDITSDITITGAGATATRIDGGGDGTGGGGFGDRILDVLGGQVVVRDLTIQGGDLGSSGQGAGVRVGGGVLVLQRAILQRCWIVSDGQGGALYVGDARADIADVLVHDCNIGPQGGGAGLYVSTGTLTLTRSAVFACNLASAGTGGGLNVRSGTVAIVDSVIGNAAVGNTADSGGGMAIGLPGSPGATVVMDGSTVASNRAVRAAGIALRVGSLDMVNCTVSGNVASDDAGGIAVEDTGASAVLRNVTVTANVARHQNGAAGQGGGIFVDPLGGLTMADTIVAANCWSSTGACPSEPNPTGGPDIDGTIVSAGWNLVGDDTFTTITGDATGNVVGVDPLLGPLQANGGSTPTHVPMQGSPAIDGGDPDPPGAPAPACEPVDQRDFVRPEGAACDIGSVEAPCIDPNDSDGDGIGDACDPTCDAEPSALDRSPGAPPLLVAKSGATDLAVTWQSVLPGLYELYRGTLPPSGTMASRASPYDHAAFGQCGLAAAAAAVPQDAGSFYFLAVSRCGPLGPESSYGRSSRGVERPQAQPRCP